MAEVWTLPAPARPIPAPGAHGELDVPLSARQFTRWHRRCRRRCVRAAPGRCSARQALPPRHLRGHPYRRAEWQARSSAEDLQGAAPGGDRSARHVAAAQRAPRGHLRLRRLRPAAVRCPTPSSRAAPAGRASTSRSPTRSATSTDTSLGMVAHRGALPPLRRPSRPRLRRRPAADRPALLHERRVLRCKFPPAQLAPGMIASNVLHWSEGGLGSRPGELALVACRTAPLRLATPVATSPAMKLTLIQTGEVPVPLRPRFGAYPPMFETHVRGGRGRLRLRHRARRRGRAVPRPGGARRHPHYRLGGGRLRQPPDLDGAAARLHPRRLCGQHSDGRHLLRPPDHGRCAGRRRAEVREGLGPRPPRLRSDDAARPIGTDLPAFAIACSHQDQVLSRRPPRPRCSSPRTSPPMPG